MITSTHPPAADPQSKLRPLRYGVALAVAGVVVLALIASSILNYVYLDTIPGRASLYGLLAVALITLGTYILVRAYDRDRATRRNHLIRAGVLIGLGVLLWLLVIDVFVFTQSAGPGVAAPGIEAAEAGSYFQWGGRSNASSMWRSNTNNSVRHSRQGYVRFGSEHIALEAGSYARP